MGTGNTIGTNGGRHTRLRYLKECCHARKEHGVYGVCIAESTRASFGETGGITHVTRLLQLAEENDTFKVQALRVLGNACIDYGMSREGGKDGST